MSRKPTIKIASLDQVLSYSNEHVLVRFKKTIELLDSDYQIIFEDVLRWLWLSATVWENHLFRVRITSELAIIDQMWHTFLLFTIDYKKFCENYFEVYLHHQPYIKDKVTDSNSVTWEFEKQAEHYSCAPSASSCSSVCCTCGRSALPVDTLDACRSLALLPSLSQSGSGSM